MIDPTVVFSTSQVAPVSPAAAAGSSTRNAGDGGFLATFTALFEADQTGVDEPMDDELGDALASSLPDDGDQAGDTVPAEWHLAALVAAAITEVATPEVAVGDLGEVAAKLESVEAELAELVHRLAETVENATEGDPVPAVEPPAEDTGVEPPIDGPHTDRPAASEDVATAAGAATAVGAAGAAGAATAVGAAGATNVVGTSAPDPSKDGEAAETARPVPVPGARVVEGATPRPVTPAPDATVVDAGLPDAEPTTEGHEVRATAQGRVEVTDRPPGPAGVAHVAGDADASSLDELVPTSSVPRTPSSRSADVAASIQRVLDAVEYLENAPPPRQLTLELGDVRLRIALEEGQLRLSLLGQGSEEGSEFLEEAFAALAERGFDLGGDGRQDREHADDEPGRPVTAAPADHRRTTGLRL